MTKYREAKTKARALKIVDAYNKKYPRRRAVMVQQGAGGYCIYTYPRRNASFLFS